MEEILSRKAFSELTAEVKTILDRLTWMDRHGREFVLLGLRLVGFAIGFAIFSAESIWTRVLGMMLISYFYYGIAISGTHEAGHRSLVQSLTGNKLWGYVFADFWTAQSSLWWYRRHVEVHHFYTNIVNVDTETKYYNPWINKYAYFFVVPFFLNFWLAGKSVLFLVRERKPFQVLVYLVLAAAGWIAHVGLFSLLLPLPYAFVSAFAMRSLFAPVFVHIAIFNHIDLDEFFERPAWLPHQTRTTRNLKRNWFLDAIGGNAFIECHIEHHLYPLLSNHLLSLIRPTVTKYLTREGYVYIEEPYWSCLTKCLQHYERIFREVKVAL